MHGVFVCGLAPPQDTPGPSPSSKTERRDAASLAKARGPSRPPSRRGTCAGAAAGDGARQDTREYPCCARAQGNRSSPGRSRERWICRPTVVSSSASAAAVPSSSSSTTINTIGTRGLPMIIVDIQLLRTTPRRRRGRRRRHSSRVLTDSFAMFSTSERRRLARKERRRRNGLSTSLYRERCWNEVPRYRRGKEMCGSSWDE